MPVAFAHHRVAGESEANCVDYIFVDLNASFETVTGLKRSEVIGKKVTDLLPQNLKFAIDWIGIYNQVAATGETVRFEQYSERQGCWYEVIACSDKTGYFTTILIDITGLKRSEELAALSEKLWQITFDAIQDGVSVLDSLLDDSGSVTGIVEFVRDITERKQAEEALWESKEKLAVTLQSIGDGLWDWNVQTNEVFYSCQWKAMLGYEEDEIGNTLDEWDKRIHPEDKKSCYEALEKHLKGETAVYQNEHRLLCKDGTYKWILDRGKVITLTDDRKPLRVIGTHTDITERKQAEMALKYQLQFEKMVGDISAAIVIVAPDKLDDAIYQALRLSGEFFNADRSYLFQISPDGCFMDNTHEWCAAGVESQQYRLKNYPLDALPWWAGQIRLLKHVHIPDVEALPPEAEKEKAEFRLEKIQSLLTIPMNTDGRLLGFLGFDSVKEKMAWTEEQVALLKMVAEIITNALIKQLAEEALKLSEEKYREILASIEEGYYETDLAGNIIFCNDAAAQLLGYSREELLGMNYKQLYKEPETVFKTFHKVFLSGKPDRGFTLGMIRKNGTIGFGELSISLIKNGDGTINGFRGVARDITERIHFEERLKYLSLHDQLTGLYNRTFFEEELNRLSNGREYPVSIISADLDDLKLINDTQGHDEGDRLLAAAAGVLKESLRGSDILARVGGDEFAAILPCTGPETAESVTARIRENVESYNRKHVALPLGLSLGVATAQTKETAFTDVYKQADDLMYRDKLSRSTRARSKTVQALLSTLAERDFITKGHAQRLEKYCRKIGERFNLSSSQLSDLALLAQVHDLGKVGIPDSILFKKGPLTEEEWEIMRQHPEKGCRIALSSADLTGVADLILKHHERWDGSGYPLGLKEEEIPVYCRILAVVDAYDAMTTDRPYSTAKSKQEAIDELIRCAGSHFDPEMVKVFISLLKS
ncbi:MAG: PAS domain S-box protein [Bacillota bacterium]